MKLSELAFFALCLLGTLLFPKDTVERIYFDATNASLTETSEGGNATVLFPADITLGMTIEELHKKYPIHGYNLPSFTDKVTRTHGIEQHPFWNLLFDYVEVDKVQGLTWTYSGYSMTFAEALKNTKSIFELLQQEFGTTFERKMVNGAIMHIWKTDNGGVVAFIPSTRPVWEEKAEPYQLFILPTKEALYKKFQTITDTVPEDAILWVELIKPFATPLHEAVAQRDIPKIRALLAEGADVNAKDREGPTAFYQAVSEYARSVLNKYWREGQYYDISETELETFRRETVEIMEILIAANADVNAKGGIVSDTALAQAVTIADAEIVKILLAAGADVNAQDRFGYTPLFQASDRYRNGPLEIVKLLLDAGADVNIKADRDTSLEKTALMVAAEGGRADIVRLLIEAGADVNAQDDIGRTARDIAVKGKFNEISALIDAAITEEK